MANDTDNYILSLFRYLCLNLHLFRYLDLYLSCADFTMKHAASTCFNVFAVEIVSVFETLNHRPILCFLSLLYFFFDLVGWVTAKFAAMISHDIPISIQRLYIYYNYTHIYIL
jgi:hypothetical protein